MNFVIECFEPETGILGWAYRVEDLGQQQPIGWIEPHGYSDDYVAYRTYPGPTLALDRLDEMVAIGDWETVKAALENLQASPAIPA